MTNGRDTDEAAEVLVGLMAATAAMPELEENGRWRQIEADAVIEMDRLMEDFGEHHDG